MTTLSQSERNPCAARTTALAVQHALGLELVPRLPALYRRARSLGLRPGDADDLVQDTVERALRFAGRFELGTNLDAWLMRILFRLFLTRFRRQRRERLAYERLSKDPAMWTRSQPAAEPGRARSQIAAALQEVSPAHSAILRLVDIDELSYKDAANVLAIPVGTVMSRLCRARRALAAQLLDGSELSDIVASNALDRVSDEAA